MRSSRPAPVTRLSSPLGRSSCRLDSKLRLSAEEYAQQVLFEREDARFLENEGLGVVVLSRHELGANGFQVQSVIAKPFVVCTPAPQEPEVRSR